MTQETVSHYYRTPATQTYPKGRLVRTSKGMQRGLILDPRSGKWHGVSGIKVTDEGKTDCDHLAEITEQEAMEYLPAALVTTA